jgi:uncharacterized protein YajQ (UPF0234 family)
VKSKEPPEIIRASIISQKGIAVIHHEFMKVATKSGKRWVNKVNITYGMASISARKEKKLGSLAA